MRALGIDIGGTKIIAGVVNEQGEIISELKKFSTPKTRQEIEIVLKDIISSFDFDVVGISTAGAVNNENTKVISSTGNLCSDYREINFLSISDKKVVVENDANCAAWAEYKVGAGQGQSNIVILTLGTGVGGGIIVNGQLLKGKNGAAGEMHFKMRCDKHRKCTCGAYDCFEAYASGTGLGITAKEISKNPDITTYDVVDGVKNNDDVCINILKTWQNDIICGIIGLANIFDPDSVILSGSMAQFIDYPYVENAVNAELVTTPTKVLHAKLENNAGLVGAALLAIDK